MTFRASKSDKKKLGAIVTRTRVVIRNEGGGDGKDNGALEIVLDLLDICPELDGSAPLTQIQSATGWTVATRTISTKALRRMVDSLGRDPV